MVELFMLGEPLFMGILTLLLFMICFLALQPYHGLSLISSIPKDDITRRKSIKSLGLFTVIFGIFSQFLGLYGALQAIRVWGIVEAEMLMEGLKVSSIPLIYSLLIFALSRILAKKKTERANTAQ